MAGCLLLFLACWGSATGRGIQFLSPVLSGRADTLSSNSTSGPKGSEETTLMATQIECQGLLVSPRMPVAICSMAWYPFSSSEPKEVTLRANNAQLCQFLWTGQAEVCPFLCARALFQGG